MYIEHYKNILEYTGAHIRLQLEKEQLVLEGKNLILEYFSSHDLKIRGQIDRIMFLGSMKGQ